VKNKQEKVSDLLLRAEGARNLAMELEKAGDKEERKKAKMLRRMAKPVIKAAYIQCGAQAMLSAKGMDHLEVPFHDISGRVTWLEQELQFMITKMVMRPIHQGEDRRTAKQVAKVAEQEAATNLQIKAEGLEAFTEVSPNTFTVNPNPYIGLCVHCDRGVGGYLGAKDCGLFQQGDVVCEHCLVLNDSQSSREPRDIVKAILDSGRCWHCNDEVDLYFDQHQCNDEDCLYAATSVGQRRFCATCAKNQHVVPTNGNLNVIAQQVSDIHHTLDWYRVSK